MLAPAAAAPPAKAAMRAPSCMLLQRLHARAAVRGALALCGMHCGAPHIRYYLTALTRPALRSEEEGASMQACGRG